MVYVNKKQSIGMENSDTNKSVQLPPMISGRVDLKDLDLSKEHWGIAVARKVVESFPDEQRYTCAAGISPSGVVHFGNFRDLITSFAVARGLKALEKKVRILFSWDDYDRFRKVPTGFLCGCLSTSIRKGHGTTVIYLPLGS